MAVNYKAVAKKNPGDQAAPAKFYAQVKSSGDATLRQLAKEIATISTVSTTDAIAVMEAFLEVVPKALADGKIVRLGEFGSFSISVKGEGAEQAGALSRHHIKKTTVKFRPGKIFKQTIDTIDFKKID
jgi:predicted histone-like DNA-binding protein